MTPNEDPITVDTPTVACDGGVLGHPLVYLNLGEEGETECPYCGRRFVLAKGAETGHGH